MGRGKRLKLPPFPLPTVPRALSFFRVSLNVFLLAFIGISIESLCRVESLGRFVPGKIQHFESLGCFVRCFGFGVGFW